VSSYRWGQMLLALVDSAGLPLPLLNQKCRYTIGKIEGQV